MRVRPVRIDPLLLAMCSAECMQLCRVELGAFSARYLAASDRKEGGRALAALEQCTLAEYRSRTHLSNLSTVHVNPDNAIEDQQHLRLTLTLANQKVSGLEQL
jgi:hypothetical protein